MKFSTRNLLFALIALVLVISGYWAYKSWNKPHRDVIAENALFIEPENLYQSVYLKGEKQYVDKAIQVKGKIADFQPGQSPVCVLEIPGFPDAGIRVSFQANQAAKVSEQSMGARVEIKGICTGVLADTLMDDLVSVDILVRDAIILP